MVTPATRRLRQFLVLTHMVFALGFLALCAAVLLLTVHGLAADEPVARHGILQAALHLDDNLLADFSFAALYTGLMLAGLSQWGYFRFWWVAVKLVLAFVCAFSGRLLLRHWLTEAADASLAGLPAPGGLLVSTAVFLIAALMLMGWVARTKPWGRIGSRRARVAETPDVRPMVYVAALAAPPLDYASGLPLMALPAVAVLGYHLYHTLSPHRRSRETATG